jgi:acetoin utilization deacetylase AcuC-like enzyme
MTKLIVVSSITPDEIPKTEPFISNEEEADDALDRYNHPRYRRALILQQLAKRTDIDFQTPSPAAADGDDAAASLETLYQSIHSPGLLHFLTTAWSRWEDLGPEGRSPAFCLNEGATEIPAMIPINMPLPRDPIQQVESHSVMGQIGYYCTDMCTPIFRNLMPELRQDAAIMEQALDQAQPGTLIYALPTHPGHHAAYDSFGGYCYLNQSALAASWFLQQNEHSKVTVLDIDYHCGNGTASIFYHNPQVLVVSIHCDPHHDYPFHSGHAHETGTGEGVGTTLHVPLPPGTTYRQTYRPALMQALQRSADFGATAVVISMGLDTYDQDPCAVRRAGFCLVENDYWDIGQVLAMHLSNVPVVVVQEGGYRMDKVGQAASNVLLGFVEGNK